MRRYTFFLFSVILTFLFCTGCDFVVEPPDESGKIQVVTTIFPPYDFVREISGDNTDIMLLLSPGSESHSYEPTPQEIIQIRSCDIFIYTGGESDAWVDKVLGSMDTENMRVVKLIDCVDAVEEELLEGMELDADTADVDEKEYDEHVWTSPLNAKLIVQKLSDTLCEVDPPNAGVYSTNTAEYLSELDELDAAFRDVVQNAVRKTIVFGDRFPFRYFADTYGLECFAAFPGCSSETEPSAATLKFLIDKINTENIPVVFHIELSNGNMAETISEATGSKILLFHSCHNVSIDDFQQGLGYLDLMKRNVETLREALL